MNLVTLWFGASLFLGWGWSGSGPLADRHFPTMADCEIERKLRQAVADIGGQRWTGQFKYVCLPAWEKPQ